MTMTNTEFNCIRTYSDKRTQKARLIRCDAYYPMCAIIKTRQLNIIGTAVGCSSKEEQKRGKSKSKIV